MRTRRIGLFGASLCTLVIGVGSAAWACVPGHDHTGPNDTDHAAHAAAQAPAAPVITVAPPVEEPVPVQQQATAPAAAPVQSAPVTAAPAPAPVATRTTTAPVRTATAPVATPTPAAPAPVVATPAPAASVTPVPEAVAPATPVNTARQERVFSEVPASQESSGSGSGIGGLLLAGFGVAALVLGSAAAIRWRRNVTPPSVLPD
jgi:hypothetical protein